jgi:hypothetical protein
MILKAEARKSAPWHRNISVFLAEVRDGKLYAFATELMMTHYEKEDMGKEIFPTFSLEPEDAQALMDDLWNCGLRPSEGTGSAGALAATQKHLEDMRKLVFKE